jgi:hypothetical protein
MTFEKGKPSPRKGKPMSEEHKQKLRERWAERKAEAEGASPIPVPEPELEQEDDSAGFSDHELLLVGLQKANDMLEKISSVCSPGLDIQKIDEAIQKIDVLIQSLAENEMTKSVPLGQRTDYRPAVEEVDLGIDTLVPQTFPEPAMPVEQPVVSVDQMLSSDLVGIEVLKPFSMNGRDFLPGQQFDVPSSLANNLSKSGFIRQV